MDTASDQEKGRWQTWALQKRQSALHRRVLVVQKLLLESRGRADGPLSVPRPLPYPRLSYPQLFGLSY
jgi:hypothetical protein